MSTPESIEAVTLDVDGTLYNIRRMVWRNLWTMVPVLDFFGDLRRVREGMRGEGPFDDFRAEQARRLAAARGVPEQHVRRQVEKIIDERWMRAFSRTRPFRGVRPALEALQARGIRLGLISDYPVEPKLRGLGLDGIAFRVLIDAERIGALKPNPQPFMAAVEALGCQPGRVLHVGDREDCDVQGALAAGLRAALFARGRPPASTAADLVFGNWRRFIALLEAHKFLGKLKNQAG